MGKKTIYVPEKDEALWKEAEKFSGDESFSSLLSRLLEEYLKVKRAARGKVGRIVLNVKNSLPVAFRGRWIAHGIPGDRPTDVAYEVAQTVNGAFVFYQSQLGTYRVHATLGNALEEGEPKNVVETVAKKLGSKAIDLDI